MKIKTFHKINWRQIVIHFIGFWFFIYSFQCFAYLMDIEVSSVLMEADAATRMTIMLQTNIDIERVNSLLKLVGIIRSIGILFAFMISLIISNKEKWFWGNSVIVFLIALLSGFNLLGWSWLKNIFLTPGQIFENNPVLYFSINSAVLFLLGCFTFFSGKAIRFINKKVQPSITTR
jgi:hypothetical protein